MSNVQPLRPEAALQAIEKARFRADNPEHQPPGGGGNGEPPLETRVEKLEKIAEKTSERLVAIDKDLALIKGDLASFKQEAFRTFATKADLADAKNSIIMWVVSAIFLAQLLPGLLKIVTR